MRNATVISNNPTTNIRTRIEGGQWRHKVTIYGIGLTVYFHLWQIRDVTNRILFVRGHYYWIITILHNFTPGWLYELRRDKHAVSMLTLLFRQYSLPLHPWYRVDIYVKNCRQVLIQHCSRCITVMGQLKNTPVNSLGKFEISVAASCVIGYYRMAWVCWFYLPSEDGFLLVFIKLFSAFNCFKGGIKPSSFSDHTFNI